MTRALGFGRGDDEVKRSHLGFVLTTVGGARERGQRNAPSGVRERGQRDAPSGVREREVSEMRERESGLTPTKVSDRVRVI